MRLIDAEKLRHEANNWLDEMCLVMAAKDLDDAPAVDAVPVVRCKDCNHRYTEDCPMRYEWSEWHDGWGEYIDCYNDNTEDNYFCHKGERK